MRSCSKIWSYKKIAWKSPIFSLFSIQQEITMADCPVCLEPLAAITVRCSNNHVIHLHCFKKLAKKECILRCDSVIFTLTCEATIDIIEKVAELLPGDFKAEATKQFLNAAAAGNLEALKQAVAAGADVHATLDDGKNAIVLLATRCGNDDKAVAIGEYLLEHKVDMNQRFSLQNNTPLLFAAYKGKYKLFKFLRKNGANPTIKNDNGDTILHLLHFLGNRVTDDDIKYCLRAGLLIDEPQEEGETPLHKAVMRGNVHVARLLLDNGASVDAQCNRFWTSLHVAARKGDTAMAELLLERGANINAKKSDGYTALHLAALNGHSDTAKLLLERGADTSLKNKEGKTPLDLAKSQDHQQIVEWIKAQESPEEASTQEFFAAIEGNNPFKVIEMITAGFDINARKSDGTTPLIRAIECGNRLIAELLLEKKADINAQNEDGNSALHTAILNCNLMMLAELLSKGAEVNVKNKHGKTPLDLAVINKNLAAVEMLKSHGAKQSKKNWWFIR